LFEGDDQMKIVRNIAICLAAILLSVPLAHGHDLAKYRDFSLGVSLTAVSNQVNAKPADVSVIQQIPALIQELRWWPTPSYQPPAPPQSVQDVLFSFYNGQLYKIVVTYESAATQGLTSADMVRAFSATYGVATVPVAERNPTAMGAYTDTEDLVASWENSQDLVTLSQSPLSDAFQLVMFSKQVNRQADAPIATAVRQDREDAPQREAARVTKEADDLEALRQTNLKAFRP
jgi:hypothetical protein